MHDGLQPFLAAANQRDKLLTVIAGIVSICSCRSPAWAYLRFRFADHFGRKSSPAGALRVAESVVHDRAKARFSVDNCGTYADQSTTIRKDRSRLIPNQSDEQTLLNESIMTKHSRRDALAAAGALLLGRSAGAIAAGQAAPAVELRLGLVTYNWGRDWDLPTVITNCARTGFSGVELRSTHAHGVEISLNRQQRAEVRSSFDDSPVELMGLGSACEYHASDPAELKRNLKETRDFLQLSHDVGSTGVKVRPNRLPADVPVEKTIDQIGRSLNEVGRMAEDLNQQIRVEVHGQGTSELPVMKAIMDVADHPSVAVCWNCNPTDMNGEGFEHNFALVRDRMATVHIHDLRSDQYPWKDLFARLKQVDTSSFTGWTLLEDGKVPKDIVQAMHDNTKLWKRLAG
jgi:sugar phosphate isomerase/epimerase